MQKAIRVKRFQMWNVSVSMLFGASPKVKWICGECGGYNESRFCTSYHRENPKVGCMHCGRVNYIPVMTGN